MTTRKNGVRLLGLAAAVLIGLTALVGCNSNRGEQKTLDDEQLKQVLLDNIIMTKDGYKLTTSRADLLKQGITAEQYDEFLKEMKVGGEFFKASFDSLGPDEHMYFTWDLDKIDTTGMDKRLIIVDDIKGDTLDMSNP